MIPAQAASSLQAAIVDLDGTLVDTLGDFHAALDQTLARLAQPRVPQGVVPVGECGT